VAQVPGADGIAEVKRGCADSQVCKRDGASELPAGGGDLWRKFRRR
jgi:hypothetical protein